MTIHYNNQLKPYARTLRSNQTDAEALLWSRIRRKQVNNIQFYRQRPIANYIVDFYAHAAKLVIEVDGGQHFEEEYLQRDRERDACLEKLGLRILRFDNLQVLQCIDEVIEVIFAAL